MTYCGIEYSLKNRPALDGDFLPFAPWRQAYLAQAAHPHRIAIERQDGQTAVFDTRLRGGPYRQADLRFLERTVKLLLWSVGGWRVCLCGCDELADELRRVYRPGGQRAFDVDFMETVFERPFRLEAVAERDFPAASSSPRKLGGPSQRLPHRL